MPNNPGSRRAGATLVPAANKIQRGAAVAESIASASSTLKDDISSIAVPAPSGAAGGDLTGAYPNPTLAAFGTSGNYQRVTTDSKGRVSAGQNDVVNVKQYGAVGDGATNDTAAINAAIAALTSYSTLYFPQGKYLITENSLSGFSGLTYLSIRGDGWSSVLYGASTGAPGNFLVVDHTCDHVMIEDIAILGSATVRGNGIGIRFYCPFSQIFNVYIKGTSDFAIHVSNSNSTWSACQKVTGCLIDSPLGDGIHFGNSTDGLCANNTIYNSGDDSIGIVADDVAHVPTRIAVLNNVIRNAGGLATSVSGCGIRVAEGNDIHLGDNDIYVTYEAGIRVTRYLSSTNYNNRVKVCGNKILEAAQHVGSHAMEGAWIKYGTFENNTVHDNVNGVGLMLLDLSDVLIAGNKFRNIPTGGIRTQNTTANVGTTWDGVVIKNNSFDLINANEAIYMVPGAGITIYNLFIDGNVAKTITSGAFIYYDQVNTARIVNNSRIAAATIAAGGTTAGTITTANNN